ncbi:HK97 family phage prohead protease [Mesorhizobium sp. 131-2-1]|uniref:HK97 family phage prohead protease n=1 Tax=Mesorhizobium sp. 131-2-1 TaxID=2744518 RepID=UPI00192868C8|nr:HK97 family phage prohead protease [Mesorhizobium sp. 131-2-1]BCG94370.1 hypothetical protein MesoLj131a_32340 [Mesorhizobium sp. 131-2-1]
MTTTSPTQISRFKFASGGRRIISGIATTGRLDHYNDIVEPLGGHWTLPVKLLIDHDEGHQVGEVIELSASNAALRFKARIDSDDCWQRLQKGELRHCSIKFQGIDWDPIVERGGRDHHEWNLLELSLTDRPANIDTMVDRLEVEPPPLEKRPVTKRDKRWVEISAAEQKRAAEIFTTLLAAHKRDNPSERFVGISQAQYGTLKETAIFAVGLATSYGKVLDEEVSELRRRVADLEAGIVVGSKYMGVWQKQIAYPAGSLSTHRGSLWHANGYAAAGVEPGDNPATWTLCAKTAEAPLAQRDTAGRRVTDGEAKKSGKVEITTVTRHDAQGRILETRKVIEDD